MKLQFPVFAWFTIFYLAASPLVSHAQHSGNTCAVSKSPYRISMDSGKAVYASQCVYCHQADGLGMTGINPPLNSELTKGDKKTLVKTWILSNAHKNIIGSVNTYTVTQLNGLSDQEIADVLTYIRNSFGNKASSVKVSDVKSTRSKMKMPI